MHEKLPRRQFLKQTAGVVGSVAQLGRVLVGQEPIETAEVAQNSGLPDHRGQGISYPRRFEGNHLKMISFPLGGVAAGSLGLGGRGQLRDWEIFNRPNKGYSPSYAFPAIRVQSGTGKPVARILESRLLPPFEGAEGLGSANASGISRLQSAKFTGAYPIAHIDFEDPALPIQVELDAFSPFIPHDPDDSGLPVAVLRYRVTNSKPADAMVSIAFSIDNPIPGTIDKQKRLNEYLAGKRVSGLRMSSPVQSNQDPAFGTFAVGAIPDADTKLTHWRGWPEGEWWNSPLLFWDTFSADGELGAEPRSYNTVGCLCQQRTIPPGQSASFTFLLGWHFPNRTPKWCSWTAPPGKDGTIIGNYYAKHFRDAWEVVEFTADHLESLETRTRLFARAFRESTVPDVVKEAASANLSTLASTTCFRTGDGEFRAFEGSGDHSGKGYGNCVHVWNYETATAFLFPSFSRSLRKAAFGFSEDDAGAIHARQVLPDGETRDPVVAADGQMGQIMHAFLDWQLSGDDAWLRDLWPRIKKAVAFAWVAGGWDPDKTGVLGGVQNNTYDVAFYGPNPLCAIYYLGALRAAEKMALAIEDKSSAAEYKDIYDRGSKWIEMNLFNGEFYTQQIKSYRPDQVYPALRRTPSTDINNPDYQVGKGCLVDQLTGQYLAHVMNLGNLVSPKQIVTTLQSIYKYNYRRSLAMHDNSARTYALDDEAALVICDYSTSTRPRIPFPYFAEVWSGLEHSTAALMIYCGMMDQGLECITNVRSRYDGEKRNPWNEAEYGHHYARPMAAWSSFIAVSGFHYDAPLGAIVAVPRVVHSTFRCFWSTGTGWGTFSYDPIGKNGTRFTLRVLAGKLRCSVCEITGMKGLTTARSGGQLQAHTLEVRDQRIAFRFDHPLELAEGGQLEFESNP